MGIGRKTKAEQVLPVSEGGLAEKEGMGDGGEMAQTM
jgi:hypothetical protein